MIHSIILSYKHEHAQSLLTLPSESFKQLFVLVHILVVLCHVPLFTRTHACRSNNSRFVLQGLLCYPSWSRKQIFLRLTENTEVGNSARHAINPLVGSRSHKKRRSSSAMTVVLVIFTLDISYKWIQIMSLALSIGKGYQNVSIHTGCFRKTDPIWIRAALKLGPCFWNTLYIGRGRQTLKNSRYTLRIWLSYLSQIPVRIG